MGNVRAKRFNKGKPQYSLIDYKALEPLVKALENGATKYGRDDWKKGMPQNDLVDSLIRHLAALNNGETHDPESGVHHIGHIMANAMFYSHFYAK